jgi:hypothetical protein
LIVVTLLGVFAGAGAAAAQAPRASDFERAVRVRTTAATASASARQTIAINPRRRFELVGFRWRGKRAPVLAMQSYGARGWSSWLTLDTAGKDGPDVASLIREHADKGTEPIWTGAATRLRLRVSGSGFGQLRAHFVRVTSASAIPANAARAASTGGARPVGPAKPTGGPGRKSADAPAIVPRAQWGADSCRPRVTPGYGEVLGAVVHHTDSTNSYSQAEAASVVLGICRYHRNSKGWNDIGYNLLIDRFGTVYEGRAGGADKAVIGAHSQGYNSQTAGIALIGGFMSSAPPEATIDALKRTLEWKLGLAGITRNERVALISTGGASNKYNWGRTVFTRPIAGHRDLDTTSCPGNVLYAKLDGLASFLSSEVRAATRMSVRLKRVAAGNGQVVSVAGRLRSAGRAVAGKQVSIQAFTSAGWQEIAQATTNANGVWATTVAPKGRYYLRGTFAGDSSLRAGRSLWRFSPKIKRPTAA